MIFGLKGKIPVQELPGCFYNGYLFGNDEASAEEPRKNQSKVKEITGRRSYMILPLKNLFSAVILQLSSENPFLAPDVSRETFSETSEAPLLHP